MRLRHAGIDDASQVLALAHAFWLESGAPSGDQQEQAILSLLRDERLGHIYLIESPQGAVIGYAAVCWGYSIEFGGRDAFLDEFFIAPADRGKNLGSTALQLLLREVESAGAWALHLEVLAGNMRASNLYRRAGFKDRHSSLSTVRFHARREIA